MYIVVGVIMGEVVVYLFFQTCFAVIGLSQCALGDARVEYRPKNENVGYVFVPCHCFCFRCRWGDEACLVIKARQW